MLCISYILLTWHIISVFMHCKCWVSLYLLSWHAGRFTKTIIPFKESCSVFIYQCSHCIPIYIYSVLIDWVDRHEMICQCHKMRNVYKMKLPFKGSCSGWERWKRSLASILIIESVMNIIKCVYKSGLWSTVSLQQISEEQYRPWLVQWPVWIKQTPPSQWWHWGVHTTLQLQGKLHHEVYSVQLLKFSPTIMNASAAQYMHKWISNTILKRSLFRLNYELRFSSSLAKKCKLNGESCKSLFLSTL